MAESKPFRHMSYVGHYAKEPSAIPGVYNGMRMEVLDRDNELLFVADAKVMNERLLELVRTGELLRGDLPDGLAVSVRGFNAYQNCGVHIEGKLSRFARGQDSAWLVRDLDLKGLDAGRAFSRRPIEAQAWIRPLPGDGPWQDCKVVNASAGGVCFRCREEFEAGAKLSIRFRLRRDHEQPPLAIAVRRVTDKGGQFEYGCEFVDLNPEVDLIIIRTMIQLQIMQDSRR